MEHATQMRLAENNQMVQTFSSDRSDQARILLGRPVLSLYDKAGRSRLTLEDGLFAIIDKAGNVRVKLEEFKGEALLGLFDEDGLGLKLGHQGYEEIR